MSISEFQIIKNYFDLNYQDENIIKGIGDDCAIVTIPPEYQLAVSMDTLVSGVHFPSNTKAYDIGYKALAVNLSDLAAMGAIPKWMTVSLSFQETSKQWLKDFTQGLFDCAKPWGVKLIGGDTVRSNLSITIQIHGWVKPNKAIYRDGSKVGDNIYLSNAIGEASAGLYCLNNNIKNKYLEGKLNKPHEQVKLGLKLLDIATSCIDISDGLSSDLGHILSQSHVGAEIDIEPLLNNAHLSAFSNKQKENFILNGGDDYQLCFTAKDISSIKKEFPNIIKIGKITKEKILKLKTPTGYRTLVSKGYNHFG